MLPVRIRILRYVWETAWSGARLVAPWPDPVFHEIFQAANGWSVRDFWRRATLGLVELDFDIAPWGILCGQSQETLKDDRAAIIGACRRQAELDGLPLRGYDHLIAFVHEPPADTGMAGGDAVLDQGVILVERYYQQIGGLLGFGPTLGPKACCVMGRLGPPAPSALAVLPGVELWRTGRRLAVATLYRYSQEFAASSGVLRVDPSTPRTITVAAADAGQPGPVLAVVCGDPGTVTFEYHAGAGIVVHSIGIRSAGGPDPVCFEARFPATPGTELTIAGIRARVTVAAPATVTLELVRTLRRRS